MDAGHAQLRHIREDSADGDKHSLNKRKLQVFFAVGDGLQGLPDDGERRGGQDQRRQARKGIHDEIPRPVVGLTVSGRPFCRWNAETARVVSGP